MNIKVINLIVYMDETQVMHNFAWIVSHMFHMTKKGFQKKSLKALFSLVGMERFELSTPRPPDEYSNHAELHPEWLQS